MAAEGQGRSFPDAGRGADGADGVDGVGGAAGVGAAHVVPAAAAGAGHPVGAPLRCLPEVVGVAASAGVLVVREAAVRLRRLPPLLRTPLGAHPLRQPALLVPDGPEAFQRGCHVRPATAIARFGFSRFKVPRKS